MPRSILTGIDIGTSAVRVVVAERNGDAPPKILGTGFGVSRGLRHGYINHYDEAVKSIRRALRAAEKMAGVPIREAFVAIGGITLGSENRRGGAIISRADGEITDLDVRKAIIDAEGKLETQNYHTIYATPLRFFLDGNEVLGRPYGLKGMKLEVEMLFVTSLSQHVNDIERAVEDAGIAVADIVPAPLAASIVTLSPEQKIAGVLLANIGSETISVCVHENNVPTSLQVFPIGGTKITNDIALGLKIPLEEAENIKCGGDAACRYPARKLNEIIEARLSDIFELIDGHLKKLKRSGLLPAGIVLTGGGAGLERVDELARNTLRLPARLGRLAGLESAEYNPEDASWAVAYGLCLWAPEHEDSQAFKQWFRRNKAIIVEWIKRFLP